MPDGIRRVVGRPGLCPPPGFAHLDGLELEEESVPLSASPPLVLPAPFPAPTVPPSASPAPSTEFEEVIMTNAVIEGHHPDQVVATLQHKAEEGLVFQTTGNHRVLHLDWIAGNPRDPVMASSRATKGVAGASDGVGEVDHSQQWSKSLFYGDWLSTRDGEAQNFLEIQVKRISGSDPRLLEVCGISPEYVWLPLQDEQGRAPEPIVKPSVGGEYPVVPTMTSEGAAAIPLQPVSGQAPVSSSPEDGDSEAPTAEHHEDAPSPSADKGKGPATKVEDEQLAHRPLPDPALARQQVMDPVSSGRPSRTSQLMLNIAAVMDAPSDDSTSRQATSRSPAAPFKTHRLPQIDHDFGLGPHDNLDMREALSVAQRIDLKAQVAQKSTELRQRYSFLEAEDFKSRLDKSFVYAVRVVAIPTSRDTVNHVTGPPLKDRQGTILAMGGWVAPPMEERLAHRNSHPAVYEKYIAPLGQYEGVPKPQIQTAMRITFDRTGWVNPRYYGELPPVWHELGEPTLEDVFWMAWQLVSGKQYCGFQHGCGFGVDRLGYHGNFDLLNRCPFQSPSSKSMYHSANWPRGKETSTQESNMSTTPAGSPVKRTISPAIAIRSRSMSTACPVTAAGSSITLVPDLTRHTESSVTAGSSSSVPSDTSHTARGTLPDAHASSLNTPTSTFVPGTSAYDSDPANFIAGPVVSSPSHTHSAFTPGLVVSDAAPSTIQLIDGSTSTASATSTSAAAAPLNASTAGASVLSSAELAATRPSVPVWLAASPYHFVNFAYPRTSPRSYGVSDKVQPRPGGPSGGS